MTTTTAYRVLAQTVQVTAPSPTGAGSHGQQVSHGAFLPAGVPAEKLAHLLDNGMVEAVEVEQVATADTTRYRVLSSLVIAKTASGVAHHGYYGELLPVDTLAVVVERFLAESMVEPLEAA